MGEEEKNTSNSSNSLNSSNGSGGSNTSRIKTILEAIGIEGVFIAVILLVIFGILSYLNIIPIGSILQGSKIPFLSNTKNTQEELKIFENGKIQLPNINKNINAEINAYSNETSYKLEILNKDDLIKKLKEWEIYGRVYAVNAQDSTPLDTINIYLTGTEQPEHKLLQTGTGVLYSSKTTFSGNTATILIYISPKTLSNSKLSPTDKGMIVEEALIVALYSYAHAYEPATQIRSQYTTILKELGKNKQIYFAVR